MRARRHSVSLEDEIDDRLQALAKARAKEPSRLIAEMVMDGLVREENREATHGRFLDT